MKKQYLCIVKNGTGGSVERLDYGVMVTQQILVLFFQVRVLVVQLKSDSFLSLFFYIGKNKDSVSSCISDTDCTGVFDGYTH